MPFTIIRNDITKLDVDAIVNPTDTKLQMGDGVCGLIFSAAGADRLQNACDDLAPIETGEAVITQGFDLPAKYIIHTAVPVYRDGEHEEKTLLRSCYTNALKLAKTRNCESIAFPLISGGVYGYPKAEAFRIATAAIREFIGEHDMDVSLVVFDKESLALSEELFGAVDRYVGEHYVEETRYDYCLSMPAPAPMPAFIPCGSLDDESLDDLVGNLDEPFSATLLRLIGATGRKDAEVYRRANIDRRLFSKIRSNRDYIPSKPTVLAFAVALELTLDQTSDLLERAGFALSHSRKFDVIVEYFIANRRYDIFEINEVLFGYDQPLLGGV
jgi:O-acetyl-ADP-ribose deacetylase (regulator of RNase III)